MLDVCQVIWKVGVRYRLYPRFFVYYLLWRPNPRPNNNRIILNFELQFSVTSRFLFSKFILQNIWWSKFGITIKSTMTSSFTVTQWVMPRRHTNGISWAWVTLSLKSLICIWNQVQKYSDMYMSPYRWTKYDIYAYRYCYPYIKATTMDAKSIWLWGAILPIKVNKTNNFRLCSKIL